MKPKFRAWYKENKEMKLVNEIIGLYAFDNDYPIVRCLGDVELLNNEYELMQSTGLHDKYGVEIFEGDILKIKDSRLAVYVVEWHRNKFMWVLRYQKDKNQYFPFYNVTGPFFEDLELLGNIYENFELLEETE